MTDLAWSVVLLLLSLTLTYLFCIRPMQRGRPMAAAEGKREGDAAASAERESEINRLRLEVAALRSPQLHTPSRDVAEHGAPTIRNRSQ